MLADTHSRHSQQRRQGAGGEGRWTGGSGRGEPGQGGGRCRGVGAVRVCVWEGGAR